MNQSVPWLFSRESGRISVVLVTVPILMASRTIMATPPAAEETGGAIMRAQPRVLMGGGFHPLRALSPSLCGIECGWMKKATGAAEETGRAITCAQPRVLKG